MSHKNQDADVAFVRALAELLRENDLSELEVMRESGPDNTLNVRVARQMETQIVTTAQTSAPAQPAPQAAAPTEPAVPVPEDPAQLPGAVTSPMVGTAYLQPEPGAAPFVNIGDQVSEGQTLLIIEAMKTMNHIHAPRAGTVERILVEDGAPVEFGDPLMIIN